MLFFFSFNFARSGNNKNDCPEHFFTRRCKIFRVDFSFGPFVFLMYFFSAKDLFNRALFYSFPVD